jgi:hypothetical protein
MISQAYGARVMPRPFRLLVCGGRDFDDRDGLYGVLDRIAQRGTPLIVIHGCAPGADTLAGEWARERGVMTQEFPADWTAHGHAAGPIRNQQMIDEGRPDGAVAFPGKRGTNDMFDKLTEAGIRRLDLRTRPRASWPIAASLSVPPTDGAAR